jgi:hypothetical protein
VLNNPLTFCSIEAVSTGAIGCLGVASPFAQAAWQSFRNGAPARFTAVANPVPNE